jgi:hypothetical protein
MTHPPKAEHAHEFNECRCGVKADPAPPVPASAGAAPLADVLNAARTYFDKGRCSGHDQFNGRYCRDAAGWEQWCIHCTGFKLLEALSGSGPSLPAKKEDDASR